VPKLAAKTGGRRLERVRAVDRAAESTVFDFDEDADALPGLVPTELVGVEVHPFAVVLHESAAVSGGSFVEW
jgi:hypothetical protein